MQYIIHIKGQSLPPSKVGRVAFLCEVLVVDQQNTSSNSESLSHIKLRDAPSMNEVWVLLFECTKGPEPHFCLIDIKTGEDRSFFKVQDASPTELETLRRLNSEARSVKRTRQPGVTVTAGVLLGSRTECAMGTELPFCRVDINLIQGGEVRSSGRERLSPSDSETPKSEMLYHMKETHYCKCFLDRLLRHFGVCA